MTALDRPISNDTSPGGTPASVIVVAPAGAAAELARVLERVAPDASVQVQHDPLDALAWLAGHAVELLLVHVDAVEDGLPQTLRAFRDLAPDARMLLVTPPEAEPDAMSLPRGAIDEYLIDPVEPKALAGALGVTLLPMPVAAVSPTFTVSSAVEPRATPLIEPPVPLATPPSPGTPMPASQAHVVGSAPAIADDQIGDIDLIDALLSDRAKFRDLALRSVAARCGIAGVALAENPEGVPAGHAAAPVKSERETLAVLHAPSPAQTADLLPWADWLARWFGLEGRMADLTLAAYRDELTGLWNRRYFNRFLERILKRASDERFRVTLLLFDIDDFKTYNDRFGHPAGDEILREAGRLLRSVVREHDIVARVGGDEFVAILWDADQPRRPNSQHPADAEQIAHRFQRAICEHRFPKLLDSPGTLTMSSGLATFPWDGRTPDDLYRLADERAMRSKREGKNAITFGPDAGEICRVRFEPKA